jgi:hypothetical protein
MPVDRITALVIELLGRQRLPYSEQLVAQVQRLAQSVDADDVERLASALEREVGQTLQWLGGRLDEVAGASPLPVSPAVVHAALDTLNRLAGTSIRTTANVVSGLLERGEQTVIDLTDDAASAPQEPTAEDLPIEQYDSLNALTARDKVQELHDVDDVAAVLAYERANRNRKTVVGAAQAWLDELRNAAPVA